MVQISGITSSPRQTLTVADPNTGNPIDISLFYQPRTQEWYIGLVYGSLTIASLKLVRNPNLLDQWSNIIPFGLMVFTPDEVDPCLINDFVTGRVVLWLLLSSEVADIEAGIIDGTVTG